MEKTDPALTGGQYPPPLYTPTQGMYPPPDGSYPPLQQSPPPKYAEAPPLAATTTTSTTKTTTIVTQPAVMTNAVLRFSEYPMQIVCPHCQSHIVTSCEYEPGTFTWLLCILLFFLSGGLLALGCCLIPFCLDGTKDVNHNCPNCHKLVGCYRRI